MKPFSAFHVFALIAFLDVLASGELAQATTIPMDLGSSRITNDVTRSFTEINGLSLSGQNVSLDFVFSGAQFVRLFSVTNDFGISVKIQTNSPGDPGSASGTGFLSDQLGNPLQPPQDLGGASSSDGWMVAGLFPLFPGSGAPGRPFDFYDVHFELTLPSNSSYLITGSEFELVSLGANEPFGVGPNLPRDLVPDTGNTFILLTLSASLLVALLIRVRHLPPHSVAGNRRSLRSVID